MAQAPSSRRLGLTRDQLASFLTDHEQIKQFESLFDTVDTEVSGGLVTEASILAGTAYAVGNEALAGVAALNELVAPLVTAPPPTGGTVTSVAASGGTTGLTFSGSPITTSGTLVLGGTLVVANGGTGATNATDARFNLSAAKSGANSDITSLSGITGSISTVDSITFDTAAAITVGQGQIAWNAADGTLDIGMGYDAVTQQVGLEQYFRIKASAAITDGQCVMFTGSVGASGVLTGAPATGVTNPQYIMGVATMNIANNGFGYITSFGIVRGINTTGASVGETWVDGDILYYNPAYVGGLTKVPPTAPLPKVVVASVVNAGSGGSGSLFVRVQGEPDLHNLSDVYAPSPIANGQILIGDGPQSRWESATLTAGTNVSITNGAGAITINATDQYVGTVTSVSGTGTVNGITLTGTVTSSGSLTLGGTLSGVSLTSQVTGTLPVTNGGTGTATAFTAGSVVFADASGIYSQNNSQLFWDNSSFRLGIGNASPGAALDVTGNIRLSAAIPNIELNNGGPMVYAPAANTLAFATGGGPGSPVERFRVGPAGQWGIAGATYGTAGQVFTSGGASAPPTWTTPTTGTVTSVSGTGTVNGITLTGTVTSSGSLTLGGTLSGVSLTSQVSGTLPVGNGGTGTATTFTSGSVVFAGSSGVYAQDNSNFFWDDTNNRLGIGTASPAAKVDSRGVISIGGAADASLHISQVYGGNGRLSQMSVNSNSTDALNIIASKNGGGSEQWFSYGVTAANVFNIQQGVGLGTAGLNISSNNQVLINTNTVSGASLNHTLEANGDIMSTGSAAGLFWANRSAAPSPGSDWYGWYTTGGTIYLYNPAAGNIASINASTGAYTALSDAAKKKDFEPSSIGLDAVMALKPTLFRMETDDAEAPKQLGFIAQEVKDHIPQAYVEEQNVDAVGNESVYIGLNDRPIIAALVKAVQELTARVAELEGK